MAKWENKEERNSGNPLCTWYVSLCVETVCCYPFGFVLILQEIKAKARKRVTMINSHFISLRWTFFSSLVCNLLGESDFCRWYFSIVSSYSPKSNSHFSLSDCEEKRPRERRENINNGEIITIFRSVKMSISEKGAYNLWIWNDSIKKLLPPAF